MSGLSQVLRGPSQGPRWTPRRGPRAPPSTSLAFTVGSFSEAWASLVSGVRATAEHSARRHRALHINLEDMLDQGTGYDLECWVAKS